MPVKNYQVREGDTLSQIASNYGVGIDAISGYSSGDPNKIGVGENLSINTPEATPVNRINAADLGQPTLSVPPTPTGTKKLSLQTLADSTTEKISGLQTTVNTQEEEIKSTYQKLGSQATKRVDAYANEETPFGTVNEAQKELTDINNRIKRKELAYRRAVERVQEDNPTGQLSEGQRLAIEKIDREWAREAADLSLIAEVKLGNYNAAKGIIDEKVDAETEDLTTRLAQLTLFYNQNYNKLTDLERTQLQQETAIVNDELQTVRAREQQIGALQLEAARNGADTNTILAIGKATDVTEAIAAAGGYIKKKETGSGGGTTFTKTQAAKGAAAAGMTLEEFNALDDDTKNFYINSYGDAQKMVEEAFNSGSSLEDVQQAISEAGLPQQGVDSLNEYANELWDSNFRPLTAEEQYSDIVNALTGYRDDGYSRSEAYDAEYSFQTTDSKGKALNLPKSQLKEIEKNIKDAQVEVYGRTFWQKILPGGR